MSQGPARGWQASFARGAQRPPGVGTSYLPHSAPPVWGSLPPGRAARHVSPWWHTQCPHMGSHRQCPQNACDAGEGSRSAGTQWARGQVGCHKPAPGVAGGHLRAMCSEQLECRGALNTAPRSFLTACATSVTSCQHSRKPTLASLLNLPGERAPACSPLLCAPELEQVLGLDPRLQVGNV